jgi:hypothetical protein
MLVRQWLYRLSLGCLWFTISLAPTGCGKEQAAAPTSQPDSKSASGTQSSEKFIIVGKSIGATVSSS